MRPYMWMSALVLLCAFNAFVSAAGPPSFRALGTFAVQDCSFSSIVDFHGPSNTSLLISSFSGNPRRQDTLHIVRNISQYFPDNIASVKVEVVTENVTWPNQSGNVPSGIFGDDVEYSWVGGGFLVPGKKTGAVTISEIDSTSGGQSAPNGNAIVISPVLDDYFYHICLWHDMNGDGLMDCVAAHTDFPLVGNPSGQLVFFAQPPSNPLQNVPWDMTVLAAGPDIFIHFTEWYGDGGQPAIIAAQFFSDKLVMYWTDEKTWTSDGIQSVVIDSKLGAPFDVQVVDLNNDGVPDLLASNHQAVAEQSAVFAYVAPSDWKTGTWVRHVLTNNITTLKKGEGQASPGNAVAFSPSQQWAQNKKWILLSGDGAEYAYLLTPDSEDPDDWSYTRQEILYTACTVGEISVGDVDGDGYADFFIPAYEKGQVHAYTFAP